MNKELFWTMLEKEHKKAEAFCRKLCGNSDDGDDLYQSCLLVALDKIDNLRDRSAFRPWLYRIIVNSFKNRQKHPWWRKKERLTSAIVDTIPGEDPTDAIQARFWLRHAFKAVSSEEQAILILFEIEGWSIKELASLFSISEGTLKSKLSRTRRKMRDEIVRKFSVSKKNQKFMRPKMQCHEIKQLLNEINSDFNDEVLNHLEGCLECKKLVHAETILRRGVLAEKHSEDHKATDLSLIKMKVGAKEAAMTGKDSKVMSYIKTLLINHRKATISISITAAMLFFFTLIPFPYTVTTGYTVDFHNAGDNAFAVLNPVTEALDALGYKNVTVNANSDGNRTTVSLYGLPNFDAAREAAAVFNTVTNFNLKPEIIPVLKKSSGSLYAQARNLFYKIEIDSNGKSDAEIIAEIEAKLADQGLTSIVEFDTDSDGQQTISIDMTSDDLIDSGGEGTATIELDIGGK